jgi:hypothetical protein
VGQCRRVDGDDLAHDHAGAALGALGEKIDPTAGHAVLRAVIRQRGGQRDAVAQRAPTDLQRTEESWKMISDGAL